MTGPTVRDVEQPATDERFGLRELGAADLRFRDMVEHLPAIVYVETGGHPGPTVYLSPRIEDVLGYPAKDFLHGDNNLWSEIIHPDDGAHVLELDGRSERTREPFVAEYRLRARDGRWVWFHDEAVFIPADGATPAHWQGVMIDITEQKRLERELEDSSATFRALVGQLPAVVYIESPNDDEGMLYMSPQYERWFAILAGGTDGGPDTLAAARSPGRSGTGARSGRQSRRHERYVLDGLPHGGPRRAGHLGPRRDVPPPR